MDHSKRTSGITIDEWKAALEAAFKHSGEGLTREEIQKIMRCSPDWATHYIKAEIEAGRMRFVGKRPVPRVDGQINYVPVYMANLLPPV